MRCSFQDGGTKIIPIIDVATAADGKWHSAGFTYDGENLTAYFDGLPAGSLLNIPDDKVLHNYPSTNGGRTVSNSSFFAGEMG